MAKNDITPPTEPTAAEVARDTLAKHTAQAKTAGLAVLRKHYGADADSASVSLALRTARVMAGEKKPRGTTGQKINDTLKALEGFNVLDSVTLAKAARQVLDTYAAKAKAAREAAKAERKAARDLLNDRSAPIGDRRAAFEMLTAMDAEAVTSRQDALMARVTSAVEAARDAGMSAHALASIIEAAFPGYVVTVEDASPIQAVA